MESLFVYIVLILHLIAYICITFQMNYVENFSYDESDYYQKQQGNLISIINIYDRSQIIRTTYSTNVDNINSLDNFKSTVKPISTDINSIRNAWVNYKNQTGKIPTSIIKELDKQYKVLQSLKSTISKCVSLIKNMIDSGMSDTYRV